MSTQQISKWSVFKEILKQRITRPLGHPEYIMYFILINIGFGALGVYVSVYIDWADRTSPFDYKALNTNLYTFYIAILASGCFDLILSKAKIMRNTMTVFSILVLVLGIASMFVSTLLRLRYGLSLSLIFCIISFFVWWIANADNEKLLSDEVKISDLTGGNLTQKVQGDLGDFKTS